MSGILVVNATNVDLPFSFPLQSLYSDTFQDNKRNASQYGLHKSCTPLPCLQLYKTLILGSSGLSIFTFQLFLESASQV